MGIGFAGVGVLADQHRLHAIRKGQGRNLTRRCREATGPEFQPKTVLNNQVRAGGLLDVTGGGLVSMNFRSFLDDRAHLEALAGHLPGHVSQDRERGQNHRASRAGLHRPGCPAANHQTETGKQGKSEDPGERTTKPCSESFQSNR